MKAIRKLDKKPNWLDPCEYTFYENTWYFRTPNGLLANLEKHNVVDNGETLTVDPSIFVNKDRPINWHGHIIKDVITVS